MPRARDPNRDKAFKIYKKHNGDIDLVEIANQLSVPPGTVRGWKNKDNWNGTVESVTERSKANKDIKKPIAKEVREVLENTDLNDKQRLFCLHYIKCFNATKAYQKAYGVDYNTAASCSYRMLDNVGIKNEIARLKQGKMNRIFLEPSDIFQKYMDIAFADLNDFFEIKGSFVSVREDIDGTIVNEIAETPNGIKLKLSDRMKALEWLTDHMDMATEKQRAEIALINKRAEIGQKTDVSLMQALIELVGGNDDMV